MIKIETTDSYAGDPSTMSAHPGRPPTPVRVLIDALVRQTTVLVAQLATSGGVRAPLADIADQVFLELATELDRQGISRKVSADMFGMALRSYLRKIQRVSESSTCEGRSLREAIYDYLSRGTLVTRAELEKRFSGHDDALVRGVLHDLIDNGLVFSTGTGANTTYRAATPEELGSLRQQASDQGIDELVWAIIYRTGPISRAALLKQAPSSAQRLDEALLRLQESGRVVTEQRNGEVLLTSKELYIEGDTPLGWEGAFFDHYQAMVKTLSQRLRGKLTHRCHAVGGSTYTFDVWPSHPQADEVYRVLEEFRVKMEELYARVEAHKANEEMPPDADHVIVYVGECVLSEHDDA
jgi:hypothetical protein